MKRFMEAAKLTNILRGLVPYNTLVVPDTASTILHLDNSTKHPETDAPTFRRLLELFLLLSQWDKQLHHPIFFRLKIVGEPWVRGKRYMSDSVISKPNKVAFTVVAKRIAKNDIMLAEEIKGASDITEVLNVAHFVKVSLDLGLLDDRRIGGIASKASVVGGRFIGRTRGFPNLLPSKFLLGKRWRDAPHLTYKAFEYVLHVDLAARSVCRAHVETGKMPHTQHHIPKY